MAEQEVTGTEDVATTSGEEVVTTETSGEEATTETQTGVTEEQLTQAQTEERQRQSDYDYAVSKTEKWDKRFSELQTKYPNVGLTNKTESETKTKAKEETDVSQSDAEEYMTVGQFQSGMKALTKIMEDSNQFMRSTAEQTQSNDATALVSEMLHDYGYMKDGKWNHEVEVPLFDSQSETDDFKRSQIASKEVNNILNNHMSLLHSGVTPSQAASSFRDIIDGRFARQMKAGAQKRVEEKAVNKQQLQDQLARPDTASAPAQTKQEIDPVIADLMRARKLSGLDSE